MREKLVPLEEIFRDRRTLPLVRSENGDRSTLAYLQNVLRIRASLTLIELEDLKEIIEGADLSFSDVVQLESLARSRSAASERTQGWHAGFGDLLQYLVDLRLRKEAA